eukprot:7873062-Heterocapsa_arctica.AAC.1
MTAMTPINTHYEAGPTYHSAHNLHLSRIDYVCIPVEQLVQSVMSCKAEAQTERVSYDKQKLVQCVLNGHGREEFIAEVETSCVQPLVGHPTGRWSSLTDIIIPIAQKQFQMQKKDKVEQIKELPVLLAERRRMRHELAKHKDAGQLQ